MKDRASKVIKQIVIILALGFGYAMVCTFTDLGIPCIFNKLTGLKCPGCGVTRMCLAIMKFDFEKAFLYNRVLFCLIPICAYFICINMYRYIKTGDIRLNKLENIVLYIVCGLLIAWGIVRNFLNM